MGMTRGQMLASMSSRELVEQMAHDHLRAAEDAERAMESELASAAQASASRQLSRR